MTQVHAYFEWRDAERARQDRRDRRYGLAARWAGVVALLLVVALVWGWLL